MPYRWAAVVPTSEDETLELIGVAVVEIENDRIRFVTGCIRPLEVFEVVCVVVDAGCSFMVDAHFFHRVGA